jgi:hypothetical protein
MLRMNEIAGYAQWLLAGKEVDIIATYPTQLCLYDLKP